MMDLDEARAVLVRHALTMPAAIHLSTAGSQEFHVAFHKAYLHIYTERARLLGGSVADHREYMQDKHMLCCCGATGVAAWLLSEWEQVLS